jgi:cytidylate kinase
MDKINVKIAIDGPAGSGKSTLAKKISDYYKIKYLDTGALYRTVAFYVYLNNTADIVKALKDINIDISYDDGKQSMFLNGVNVTDEIRRPEISQYASKVSAMPEVRSYLLDIQRKLAESGNVVMDGRDIGTVIMPDADIKIFLNADTNKRAERRYKESLLKGQSVYYDKILTDMIERDKRDSSRDTAPTIAAHDAIIVDNTEIDEEETFKTVKNIINNKISAKSENGQINYGK